MAASSTWGYPTASKHVLLLHGLTGSSQFWDRVAQDLASRGYFVTAPDLLGHGLARRSSVYTIAGMAEELQPFFSAAPGSGGGERPYDIIVGYSLGALITCALLPLLKCTHPVSVVLVDPPLELDTEPVAFFRGFYSEVVRRPEVQTPETFLQQNPLWRKEDAIVASLGAWLCDVAAVEAIFDQNVPWSFSHHLSTVPENVKVSVLAADPSKQSRVREEDLRAYPHVKTKTVFGASHEIPLEFPETVVEAALGGGENK